MPAFLLCKSVLQFVSPVFESKIPVFFDNLYGCRVVVVPVFLVALLPVDVGLDGRTCLFETGQRQGFINAARHFKRVLLEVFEFYLDEIAFGYEVLVFLITIVEIGIYLDDVVYDFVVGNILQLQRLYGVCKEVARRFKYRVGIAHEVAELGIGEHSEQNLDTCRVGRVFGEETFTVGIPKRYFANSLECLLDLVDFTLGCSFKP